MQFPVHNAQLFIMRIIRFPVHNVRFLNYAHWHDQWHHAILVYNSCTTSRDGGSRTTYKTRYYKGIQYHCSNLRARKRSVVRIGEVPHVHCCTYSKHDIFVKCILTRRIVALHQETGDPVPHAKLGILRVFNTMAQTCELGSEALFELVKCPMFIAVHIQNTIFLLNVFLQEV